MLQDGMPPPEDEELITVVKASKHWGFCSHLCHQEEMRAKQLQVILKILDWKDTAYNKT